jgi:hypothetical protein
VRPFLVLGDRKMKKQRNHVAQYMNKVNRNAVHKCDTDYSREWSAVDLEELEEWEHEFYENKYGDFWCFPDDSDEEWCQQDEIEPPKDFLREVFRRFYYN